jgi:hypothetical protein
VDRGDTIVQEGYGRVGWVGEGRICMGGFGGVSFLLCLHASVQVHLSGYLCIQYHVGITYLIFNEQTLLGFLHSKVPTAAHVFDIK